VGLFDSQNLPKKRTALGRFKHENAALVVNLDGRVVIYMGDDSRGQYLYRFVSKHCFRPGDQKMNCELLAEGTFYVARFDAPGDALGGTGRWLPLRHGEGSLIAPMFSDQAEVLVFARQAAKLAGATTMDRPEWVAIHPDGKSVYCSLTNNRYRGVKHG
jgi:secreted PhoX family phosphatase